jgi:hypothetical protein
MQVRTNGEAREEGVWAQRNKGAPVLEDERVVANVRELQFPHRMPARGVVRAWESIVSRWREAGCLSERGCR